MIITQVGPGPADFADVRVTNLAVVLRFVRAHGPCSRADIAASTGLNKATVSSLVGELIDRRLVRETGLAEQRIGRPATLLVLDGAPYAAVGVAVDTDHLTVIATDLAGRQLVSWRRAAPGPPGSPGAVIAAIAALARRATARLAADGRQILGLTVAVPGPVDGAGGVRRAPTLGWQGVDLADPLRRAMRQPEYPITVENDANVAALAEYRFGGHGVANLAHVTGSTRLTTGIIADGRLLCGGPGLAGEIGHLAVDAAGPPCRCGRLGCLDAVAGIPALVARLSGSPGRITDVPVDLSVDLQAEVDDLVRRARAGEPAVLGALDDAGRALGYAASVLVNLMSCEVVALGGHAATLAPWLLPPARTELAARCPADGAADGGCRVVASSLGRDAAATGAAAKVLETVDSGQVKTLRVG